MTNEIDLPETNDSKRMNTAKTQKKPLQKNIVKHLNQVLLDEYGHKLTEIANLTGISKQNLSRIFNGDDIKFSQLIKILDACQIPFNQFISRWWNVGNVDVFNNLLILEDIERYLKIVNEFNKHMHNLKMAFDLLIDQGRMLTKKEISIEAYDILLKSMMTFIYSQYDNDEILVLEEEIRRLSNEIVYYH